MATFSVNCYFLTMHRAVEIHDESVPYDYFVDYFVYRYNEIITQLLQFDLRHRKSCVLILRGTS